MAPTATPLMRTGRARARRGGFRPQVALHTHPWMRKRDPMVLTKIKQKQRLKVVDQNARSQQVRRKQAPRERIAAPPPGPQSTALPLQPSKTTGISTPAAKRRTGCVRELAGRNDPPSNLLWVSLGRKLLISFRVAFCPRSGVPDRLDSSRIVRTPCGLSSVLDFERMPLQEEAIAHSQQCGA
jgi:hypothetical protein